jgi:hypothetical protein
MAAFSNNSQSQIPSNLLRQNKTPDRKDVHQLQVYYGASSLQFQKGPVKVVRLDHRTRTLDGNVFSFEKTAEATGLPDSMTIKDFEDMGNAVNGAGRLEDLKPVLSQRYFQLLQDKVNAGVSPYVVLAMLQAMRPDEQQVMDFKFHNDQADLIVRGRSHFGIDQGIIHLIREANLWKIDREEWQTGGKRSLGAMGAVFKPLSSPKNYTTIHASGILEQISPDYKYNRNFLSLTRVPFQKNRRAITFVFLIKKNKNDLNSSDDVYVKGKNGKVKENYPTQMHVLWTGSKKLMSEQKIVDNHAPVDFSVANFEDGYSPGQWNLILPNKKPREVVISVLMNF